MYYEFVCVFQPVRTSSSPPTSLNYASALSPVRVPTSNLTNGIAITPEEPVRLKPSPLSSPPVSMPSHGATNGPSFGTSYGVSGIVASGTSSASGISYGTPTSNGPSDSTSFGVTGGAAGGTSYGTPTSRILSSK